jgi:molybdopterin synthase sulfur carrier subunit
MPTVKLFASLRKLAGVKELSVPGSTIAAVLDELVNRTPSLNGVLLQAGEIRPHVLLTLNGHTTTEINRQVTEQDVLAIFPPIAGGTSK